MIVILFSLLSKYTVVIPSTYYFRRSLLFWSTPKRLVWYKHNIFDNTEHTSGYNNRYLYLFFQMSILTTIRTEMLLYTAIQTATDKGTLYVNLSIPCKKKLHLADTFLPISQYHDEQTCNLNEII